ncbi:MAG: DUF1343 domain-containing protein [Chitinophagaceae bacterium]
MKNVLFGVDALCSRAGKWKDSRYALVTNNAATTNTGVASRAALLKAGINITKLFSPEHSLTAKGEDGAYQHHHIDTLTKLPVISLYSDHLAPDENDLRDIDTVLFDIPDVGCRFYTYLWTMTHVMQSCAAFGKSLIVLDRPNPIGAAIENAEGPMLDEENCASFIGRWNIPVKHSCTLGELALLFAATKVKGLQPEVIKVENWNRRLDATDAGWHWVPTSPAIQQVETALLYPGMGMLEGINVNEGRGTMWPFAVAGAPWINANLLLQSIETLQIPGIAFSKINYVPEWGFHAGERCAGLHWRITDKQLFQPVKTGLALIQQIIAVHPQQCRPRLYPTVANPTGEGHLDKLTGLYKSFEKMQSGAFTIDSSADSWAEQIKPYLLY